MSSCPAKRAFIFTAGFAAAYAIQKLLQRKRDGLLVQTSLPDWAIAYYENAVKERKEYSTDEEMAKVAIELSANNVTNCTGGPFGCAIFEYDPEIKNSKLFAVGVNRVVPLNNSTLHAEMVAIQFAQKKMKCFSLKEGASREKEYTLVTSCEPCAMCLGGIMWAGVTKIICCATKDDAEAIGFDEGPVFPESYKHLEKAGMTVRKCVLQKEGAKVLQNYGNSSSSVIYNG